MAGVYERKDHLYSRAKEEGLRSRAAYKLMEIDEKFGLLKAGSRVVDLGCFPGGWLQVAAKRTGGSGVVVGIDLDDVPPFPAPPAPGTPAGAAAPARGGFAPVHILKGDARDEARQAEMLALLGGRADVLLSDMSPKLTGVRFSDAARSAELVELAVAVAGALLRPGGSFVAKIFPGSESDAIFQAARRDFEKLSRHVLKASRKTSSEYYFVGVGYSGGKEAAK